MFRPISQMIQLANYRILSTESAENSRGYYYALAGVTLLCYILSLTGITLLYIYFTTVSVVSMAYLLCN